GFRRAGFRRAARVRVVVAVVVTGGLLGACSSGDGGDRAGGGRAGDGGDGDGGEQAITFTVTEVRVESMAPQAGPFPEDVWAGAHNLLNAYLDRGLVRPLRTGQPPPAGELEPLFTPPALARVTGADRATVLEDGAALSGVVTAPRANTALVLLTDRSGGPVVVNATLDLVLSVESGGGTVALARNGQVVMIRDEHGWRIDSYDLSSLRDSVA
ncbi:MAG: hypothetical protein ACRDY5_00165, partial [Acidimicrobiales bacterium]